MLIDWFTVGAQGVNFLVLVWLLKRFLYRPILSAIDAREKGIATELAAAAATKVDADREHAQFQQKNQALDAQRDALLAKATAQAEAERVRLLAAAGKAADALRASRAKALLDDTQRLDAVITQLTAGEVFDIARQTLTDLAASDLEERMGELFTRRLRELEPGSKAALGLAIHSSAEPALVRSRFELPAHERATIQNALNETFATMVRLRFETAPAVICGIELTVNGQKLGWSIADYLRELEQKVTSMIQAQNPTAVAGA
jgi:F-type H+-transporting ATPase subunit b